MESGLILGSAGEPISPTNRFPVEAALSGRIDVITLLDAIAITDQERNCTIAHDSVTSGPPVAAALLAPWKEV